MSGFDQLSSLESGRGSYSDDPAFKTLQHELLGKLDTLRRNIARLRTEVGHLGTKRDTARVRERVTGLLDESRNLCKEIGEGVKKLQTWDDLTVRLPRSLSITKPLLRSWTDVRASQKQQKYEQQKLSTDFQGALQEFQDLQRKALEKQRATVSAARQAQEAEVGASAGSPGQLQQLQQQELVRLADQGEVDFQEALILEREEEIQNIEQGVSDLNVLFRQVAQIVTEQGEQLDTIENNVDNTRDDTRGASVELRQAAKYQKAARNKSCCLLLILGVILTIVLLAVFLD
jgi:t-SNARE complex subunit (syntaxin)